MIAKNEELLIGQAINSVKSIVDEIIVVDTGSTDRTCKVAARLGARIIPYKWDGNLGRARNVYIKNASNPWILVLDADERIAKKDLSKLKELVKDSKTLGYIFTRRDYTRRYDLLREWHPNDGRYPEEERFSVCPGWSSARYIRLFQRKEEIYYPESYLAHTDSLEFLKKYKGKIKECNIVIHHFQYLKGEEFVVKKQKERLSNEIKYLRLLPRDPRIYLNIGIGLFSRKEDDRAIRYLKKALELNPRFDLAYLVLGMVYKEKAAYKEAILNLKRAIKANPRYADALTVLGMVYDAQGRLADAEKALKRAIAIHPKHPLAHNSLGIVYEGQERFKRAESEYKKAIRIHPQHPDAYHNLGLLYHQQRKLKEANVKKLHSDIAKLRRDAIKRRYAFEFKT